MDTVTSVEVSWLFAVLLFLLGLGFGVINTLAGGGSTLSLPAMLLLGLSPHVANATNRLAGIVQTLSAVIGFMRQGKLKHPVIKHLTWYALIGGSCGSYCSLLVSPQILNYWIQICITMIAIFLWCAPSDWVDRDFKPHSKLTCHMVGLLIAFYGGFLQAGVGIICFYYIRYFWGLGSIEAVIMKVVFIAIFTLPALIIYSVNGQVHWWIGTLLALGSGIGAWLSVNLSLSDQGSDWIRKALPVAAILMVLGLALKMSYQFLGLNL